MERAASLGHSITESMFVRMCVPERMCLLKWDAMLSSARSRYSVRTCDLEKQQCIHVRGVRLPVSLCVCILAHAHETSSCAAAAANAQGEERRPSFQTRLGQRAA